MPVFRPLPLALCLVLASPLAAQQPGLLARRYHEADTLHYRMDATNQGRDLLQRYGANADAVVRRDSLGRFVEDVTWSRLVLNDSAVALPAGTPAVRQRLTLSPGFMIPPDVARTHPALIGPVLDLFTFYVDLWLAARMPLAHPGDHFRIPGQGANSWADGRRITLGEDAIDFDITLSAVDTPAGVSRLEVRHVPSAASHVHLPAEWMAAPAFGTASNWVQVTREDNGTYVAGVGLETFDVQLVVSLADGRIISATMDNPVDVLERTCRDAALTDCGEPSRYRILRRIALH